MSGIDRDEWLAALQEAECVHDQTAMTSSELCVLLGLKSSAMKLRLQKLVAEGKAISVRKHITDNAGRTQSVPAYRLVK